jgi:hypothetical protein
MNRDNRALRDSIDKSFNKVDEGLNEIKKILASLGARNFGWAYARIYNAVSTMRSLKKEINKSIPVNLTDDK